MSLFRSPGDHQRADLRRRDADLGRVLAEQLVAAGDQARLDRPGLRVESGVQNRRVRLAGAGAYVRSGLDQDAVCATKAELARDGAADRARARDRDVIRPLGHRSLAIHGR
jgi:hypothetical protein